MGPSMELAKISNTALVEEKRGLQVRNKRLSDDLNTTRGLLKDMEDKLREVLAKNAELEREVDALDKEVEELEKELDD